VKGSALGIFGTAVLLLVAADARAQDRDGVGPALGAYFDGVRTLNGAYIGIGAAEIGIGATFILRDDDVFRGVGLGLAGAGTVHLVVGVLLVATAGRRERRLAARLDDDPPAFVEAERTRMDREHARFTLYHVSEGAALGAAAVATGVGVALDEPLLIGLGAGLVIGSAISLIVDYAIAASAREYRHRLARVRLAAVPIERGVLLAAAAVR
jgi:hypothetical protein